MSGYGSFAYFYDRLTENVPYVSMAEQIARYAARFGSGDKGRQEILLDLACGTGSLSEELARKGFDVIGVDSSDIMLGLALDKKFDSGLPIQYLKQDMRELDMYGTIDVTVCALDGINHLADKSDVLKVFKCVSLFCEPGGLFIFDVNTLRKHRCVLSDNAFIYSFEDFYCGWQNEYDETDSSVHIWLDFFEEEDGVYRRYSEDFREIYVSDEDIAAMIAQAGMEIVGVFDGYTESPLTEESERAVYICKKQG